MPLNVCERPPSLVRCWRARTGNRTRKHPYSSDPPEPFGEGLLYQLSYAGEGRPPARDGRPGQMVITVPSARSTVYVQLQLLAATHSAPHLWQRTQ